MDSMEEDQCGETCMVHDTFARNYPIRSLTPRLRRRSFETLIDGPFPNEQHPLHFDM